MLKLPKTEWIVDTGASHHIESNRSFLNDGPSVETSHRDIVYLPNGDKVDISCTGHAPVFENEDVKNVLLVPDFKFNLLSVSKLTRELSRYATFFPDFYVFQDHYNGRMKGIVEKEEACTFLKESVAEIKTRNIE